MVRIVTGGLAQRDHYNQCDDCGAKCCKHIAIEIDKPEDWEDFENVKWYMIHQDVEVYIDNEEDWIVELKTTCKYLGENDKCTNYENRPQVCRDYSSENCVKYGEGDYFIKKFDTIEDIEAYKKEIGIKNEGYQLKKEKKVKKILIKQ